MIVFRRPLVLLLPLLGLLAAGCGGASHPAAATASTGASATVSTAASVSASVSASASVAAQPADVASATAAVSADWTAFFSSTTPTARRVALLQNGSALGAALQVANTLQTTEHLTESAEVSQVSFTSATMATVTYKFLGNGKVLLPDASGIAVLTAGTWQVSQSTFCTLVSLGSSTPVTGC